MTGRSRRRSKSHSHSRSRRGEYLDNEFETILASPSEETIYRKAVQPLKRKSTSSEGEHDTSDKMQVGWVHQLNDFNDLSVGRSRDGHRSREAPRSVSCHRRDDDRYYGQQRDEFAEAERRADQLIREAELSKAQMVDIPGRNKVNNPATPGSHQGEINTNCRLDLNSQFVHSAMVDQNFLMVAAHIDENLKKKILTGKYIDFARLLPQDRVMSDRDQCMELINKDGRAYYVPATDRDTANSITSFARWEQAYRVYTDIYTRQHPNRSAELIQYNHIIHTASLNYTWDSVYKYDKLFKIHMGQFPTRSWGIILQQAWSITLKDKNNSNNGEPRSGKKDACWRYNRGCCTYGNKCKFEHKCTACHKYGHGAFNCRKLNLDRFDRRDRNRDNSDRSDRNDKTDNRKKRAK